MKIEGVDATYRSAPIVTEIFRGMIAERRFDVSELGMTYFLRTFKDGESPFLAIPVFPNRAFRHSAIFINKESDIENPEDLNGKTIGELALYGHDAGIMPKGMLMDEFGFKPETCRWIVGGLDWPQSRLRVGLLFQAIKRPVVRCLAFLNHIGWPSKLRGHFVVGACCGNLV